MYITIYLFFIETCHICQLEKYSTVRVQLDSNSYGQIAKNYIHRGIMEKIRRWYRIYRYIYNIPRYTYIPLVLQTWIFHQFCIQNAYYLFHIISISSFIFLSTDFFSLAVKIFPHIYFSISCLGRVEELVRSMPSKL